MKPRKYMKRVKPYTVSPYHPPANAIRLGESRMAPFVRAYQHGQMFSGAIVALSRAPHPTLDNIARELKEFEAALERTMN